MHWLERAEPRRTHPRDLLPEARTAIVLAADYDAGDHPPPPADEGRAGKVARYAWGRDYHLVLREKLDLLAERITDAARAAGLLATDETPQYRPCVDSAPIDERALAARAGLGFIGKNTLLLHPQGGSWSLLAVLLTSLRLVPEDGPMRGAAASCGSCRRCIVACPTGAIEPYKVDPRRCVSYHTIEAKDPPPADLAARASGWAFGCDICQEVCPFNEAPNLTTMAELTADVAGADACGPWITEARLAEMPSGKQFQKRWAGSPISRPGLKRMQANVARAGGAVDEQRDADSIADAKDNEPDP